MNLLSYIDISPDIRFGKPCIKGTRIAVVDILQWLASGMTKEEILNDFPDLIEEHIYAALQFAANRESIKSTTFIEALLIKHKTDIEAFGKSREYGIIELY